MVCYTESTLGLSFARAYTVPPSKTPLAVRHSSSILLGSRFELVHPLAGRGRRDRRANPDCWQLRLPRHMTDDSPPKTPEARGASRADKNDELDANIRNFAPVARIMKNALPDNAKIAKEAKECMQECVSEFISFITSEGTCDAGY